MSEKKYNVDMILFIFLRIGASILTAFASLIITAIFFDDIDRYYQPKDYLGSTWRDFDTLFFICIFLISLLFIWSIFKLKWRLIAAGSIVILLVCGAMYDSYQNNILEIHEMEGGWTEEVNLRDYEPFRENTLAKSLDENSSLSLQNNLPRLDGATALYPLYAAFARAAYPSAEYKVYDKDSVIICSKTSGAFDNLLDGTADLIFLAGISEEQRVQANERGLELKLTPIGKEAFIFFVNAKNSMLNLSTEDITGIYSGRITNWREVGGSNKKILAYQRPNASGSQTMLEKIMGDTPIIEAPENVYDEMYGMYMAVAYKNHNNAIGYSFLYYIRDMIAENKIKFLSIDGIEPTATNIASGDYPFAHDFFAITVVRQHITDEEKERVENTNKLIKWILSPQGQSLVEKTGYVPLT